MTPNQMRANKKQKVNEPKNVAKHTENQKNKKVCFREFSKYQLQLEKDTKDMCGHTPLMGAAENGYIEIGHCRLCFDFHILGDRVTEGS